MSRDSGPVLPLEQRCLFPGRWLIEGWEVEQYRWHGHGRWWRVKGSHHRPCPGVARRTLEEVRDWIRDQRGE